MKHTVLFVEDDAELAALMRDFLARHDLDVIIEPRGDTALDAVARVQPALILLDIMLPGKRRPDAVAVSCGQPFMAPS